MLLTELTRQQSVDLYKKIFDDKDAETMRRLCKEDLFYLIFFACKRLDINKDWLYARCREVEAKPDGYIDLWSREHYKSSIITFGLTIKDILNNPEVTVGIFSHTSPIAKSFLNQIKRELENNQFLKDLFPDILYANPQKDSPRWSLDSGIVVKRQGNPKECTVESHGLVDSQPTSKHFSHLIYDDVVTRESVSSPEMIAKVTEAFGLSLNLSGKDCHKRFIGTRYHANDTYKTIIDRGTAKSRVYPATIDGTLQGKPVLMTQEQFDEKVRDMGSYLASCQLLQNPLADSAMGFNASWLSFYTNINNYVGWNFYILVDPAGEKKKTNDYTVIVCIGLAPDENYYLVDAVRDRMNLTERTEKLFGMVRKWKPIKIGYEKYGKDSDIEHIKYVQEQQGYRFNVTALGGSMAKNDRIRRLIPLFEHNRFYLPYNLVFITTEGKGADFIKLLIQDEYNTFPVCTHDDMLDCLSRICDPDLQAVFPLKVEDVALAIPRRVEDYDPLSRALPVQTSTANQPTNTWRELLRN